MKKLLLTGFLVIGAVASAPAYSDKLTRLSTEIGTCKTFMAMNVDAGQSSDKVVNTEFPNGRVGFAFMSNGKDGSVAVISFFGDGKNERHPDPDTAVLRINSVNFTFQGSTDHMVADGVCKFTNPYKGTPAMIHCAAKTSQGMFAGDFISNGVAPDTDEIP
jgi:hypothetical protein